MTTPEIPYKRKAVDPVECIKAGWELVKPQYWLFVGMTFVAFFIGSAVPLGILMGPMMCGIYLTCFARRRREPVEFGLLFKGFDFFGPSVIATLLHALPIIAILVPTYTLFSVAGERARFHIFVRDVRCARSGECQNSSDELRCKARRYHRCEDRYSLSFLSFCAFCAFLRLILFL